MIELDDAELESQLRQTFQQAAAPVRGEGVRRDVVRHQADQRQAARRRTLRSRRVAVAALATAAVAAVVVAAVALVGPEADRVDTNPAVTEPGTPTTPTTTPPSTETTTVPKTTVPSQASTPSTTPSKTKVPGEPPAFPPESTNLTHGGTIWGVYLAAVSPDDPAGDAALAAAGQAVRDAGYTTDGPTTCDAGAAEATGADPSSLFVAAYFDTEAQAKQAGAAFEDRGHDVKGIAHVTTYCMD